MIHIRGSCSESELAEDPETFEIKASIPVTVVVESVECEILYERTQTLFRNFNAAAKVATISSHADSSQHSSQRNGGSLVVPVQERLYQEVRSTEGVSIIPPRVAVSPHREENASDKGSEHSDNSNPLPPEHIYQPLDVSTMEDSVYEPLSPSSMNSCTCSDVFLPPNTSEMAKLVCTSSFIVLTACVLQLHSIVFPLQTKANISMHYDNYSCNVYAACCRYYGHL